jgi:SAM-dependent methyltransferase
MMDQSRQHQPSTWALGDYPAMAQRLLDAAGAAVNAADVRPGHTVLDVGTGTGNAAVLAARAGGVVTGVDPTPELLAVAAHRARQENLTIVWQQGAAERIDAANHTFDRVLSVFGAMYSPNPAAAANELVRCCRPGGCIVVTAWTPDSLMAATNRAVAPYLPPPPPGGTPPTKWGDADFIHGLFTSEDATVTTTTATVRFDFPSLHAAADFWTRTAGHLQAEKPRLDSHGTWEGMLADLKGCFADASTDRTGRIAVDSTYLLTTVTSQRHA